jgi:hypothetical protein
VVHDVCVVNLKPAKLDRLYASIACFALLFVVLWLLLSHWGASWRCILDFSLGMPDTAREQRLGLGADGLSWQIPRQDHCQTNLFS